MGDLFRDYKASQRHGCQVVRPTPRRIRGEQRSVGRSRCHRVHPDPGARHLHRERLHQPEDGTFCGNVMQVGHTPSEGKLRGDGDHDSIVLSQHLRQNSRKGVDGTAKDHCQHPVPLFPGDVGDRDALFVVTGCGYQKVNPSEPFDDLVYCLLERLPVGYVNLGRHIGRRRT